MGGIYKILNNLSGEGALETKRFPPTAIQIKSIKNKLVFQIQFQHEFHYRKLFSKYSFSAGLSGTCIEKKDKIIKKKKKMAKNNKIKKIVIKFNHLILSKCYLIIPFHQQTFIFCPVRCVAKTKQKKGERGTKMQKIRIQAPTGIYV